MITKTKNEVYICNHDELKERCLFLLKYAAYLYSYGATCTRILKNVNRMAPSLHIDLEITILPSHIFIVVWDKEHLHSYSSSMNNPANGNNFRANSEFSKLSWAVVKNNVTLAEANDRLSAIIATPRYPNPLVLLLISSANAAFCELFGGDAIAIGIVFVATLCGFFLKQLLTSEKIDNRIITLLSALVASIIASSAYVFHLGNTPEVALGTSVLFLVPGIPYINSMSDLLDGHYLCSFARFAESFILTVCLSLGLTGGFLLININVL